MRLGEVGGSGWIFRVFGVLAGARRNQPVTVGSAKSTLPLGSASPCSSSTTTALSRQCPRSALKEAADPRDRRKVRHILTTILCLVVVGVLAGCRMLAAMREHVADVAPTTWRP